MREIKDSGIEWIGEIPANWDTCRLQFCLREVSIKNNPIQTKQVLSLVKDKGVMPYEEKGNQGNKSKEDVSEYKLAYPDMLIVNSMNILIGSVGLSHFFGCVSPVYYVFKDTDAADLRFINYLFNTRQFQRELRKYANGILEIRLRVSADDIFKRRVPLPVKFEQQAIANFLDAKCAEIDALSSDIQAQIDTLEQYKRSVISEAVTNGLDPNVPMKDSGIEWIGEIPVGWNVSKIKYIASFGPTCNFRGVLAEDKIAYAPMECVKQGYYEERDAVYQELPRSLTPFQRGDIIMAKVTPCFENGNIAILDKLSYRVGLGSSELFVFRSKKIVAKYLFYWLQNHAFMERACATMTGAGGLKRVSSSFCKNCEIHLPPRSEQQAIVDYLDTKCSEIDQVIVQKQEQLSILANYKKSLIYEYVTGKKEVPVS